MTLNGFWKWARTQYSAVMMMSLISSRKRSSRTRTRRTIEQTSKPIVTRKTDSRSRCLRIRHEFSHPLAVGWFIVHDCDADF